MSKIWTQKDVDALPRNSDGYRVFPGDITFSGAIKDFAKRVKTTHGSNQYAKEYHAAIKLVEIRFKRK